MSQGKRVEESKIISLVLPQNITTDTTSDGISIELFENDAAVTLQLGEYTGDANLDVSVEASSDDSSEGDYAQIGAFAQNALTSGGVASIGVSLENQKWVRIVSTMTGSDTTTIVPISVTLFGGLSHESSTLNSDTIA